MWMTLWVAALLGLLILALYCMLQDSMQEPADEPECWLCGIPFAANEESYTYTGRLFHGCCLTSFKEDMAS